MLTLELRNLRTRFVGRNGWWVPNILNFFFNAFWLSWFVATEEYALSLEGSVGLTSVDSGAEIWRGVVRVEVSGTFDDFDRGWQFFGPIASSLDGNGWRGVAEKLLPAARLELAGAVAVAADQAIRDAIATRTLGAETGKVLALTIGVSSYEDSRAFPPLPYAASDAAAVASSLASLGLLPRNIRSLTDSEASSAAVRSALREHLGRARPQDVIVLHFAGYGARTPDGKPALLLRNATRDGTSGWLPLEEVVRAMGDLPGRKLVIVNAGFGGRGRSIAVSGATPATLELSPGESTSLVLADGGGDAVLAPDYLRAGLLSYHFVHALQSLDERPPGAPVLLDGGIAALSLQVAEDAENLGSHQVPRVLNAPHGLILPLRDRRPRKESP